MESSDVIKILEIFNSRDWSEYYDYQNFQNRKKHIWFKINKLQEFDFVRDIITKDIKKINKNFELSEFITFLIYEKGDFFGKHSDKPAHITPTTNTVLSGGYILNDNFEGGEFIIDKKKLKSEIGEIFTFGRNVIHEVKTVTKGTRYSLHFSINKNTSKSLI